MKDRDESSHTPVGPFQGPNSPWQRVIRVARLPAYIVEPPLLLPTGASTSFLMEQSISGAWEPPSLEYYIISNATVRSTRCQLSTVLLRDLEPSI